MRPRERGLCTGQGMYLCLCGTESGRLAVPGFPGDALLRFTLEHDLAVLKQARFLHDCRQMTLF